MRIAVEIAGFSLAKADTLRKAMGKKKQEIIDREGENFISGAAAKGHPKDKARQLWNQIVPFAKYGFNKSHSVAYAHVAYLTAYPQGPLSGPLHGRNADFRGQQHRQAEPVPRTQPADGHRDPAAGYQRFTALLHRRRGRHSIRTGRRQGSWPGGGGTAAGGSGARRGVFFAFELSAISPREISQPQGARVFDQSGLLRCFRPSPKGNSRQPRTAPGNDQPRAGAERTRAGLPV